MIRDLIAGLNKGMAQLCICIHSRYANLFQYARSKFILPNSYIEPGVDLKPKVKVNTDLYANFVIVDVVLSFSR
jgi:hypothetical protein